MSRVLLATHGGSSADGAVRVAELLADRLDTRLETFAAIAPAPIVDGGFGPEFVPGWPLRREHAAKVRTAIANQLSRCGVILPAEDATNDPAAAESAGDRALTLGFGPIAPTIADHVTAAETAVLVVGLGSQEFVDRAFGDETALRLAQIASVPVLAVPSDADALPRRVVAAIDFTETSEVAARTAAAWLAPGGTLYLVHVIRGVAGDRESDVGDRLTDLARTIELPEGVRIETTLLDGPPARAILEFAQRTSCDLIALGSHGYGPVKRLVLGSVASKLLRHAPRAVLVVPAGSQPSAEQIRAVKEAATGFVTA
jgi:nucleotide-binding universal stress UspA family protein